MKDKFKSKLENFLVKYWPYLFLILITYVMIQGQLGHRGFVMSIDTWFHYDRFYDASQQIKNNSFNYFQMNYGFSQSGRIINALYGPLFAYLMGFLVLITGTWYKFQIITYFIICLLGGTGMYRLVKKTGSSKLWSVLLAAIYINISPIQGWFDHSNLSGWGAALAPFAFIEAINMLQESKKPIRWIKLMLIMTLIAQTHVLTTVIVALALIPFVIIGFIKTKFKKQMILDLVKAVAGCLCLTANVWGALLTISSTNKLAPIRQHNLAPNALTISHVETIRDALLIIVAIVFIIQIIYVLCTFKKSVLNDVVTLVGGLFLLISSSLLPWTTIQSKLPVLRHYLQFPYRFTMVAYCLLLVGIGISLKKITFKTNKVTFYGAIVILGLVLVQNLNANYARLIKVSSQNYMPMYKITNKKYYTAISDKERKKYYQYVQGIGKNNHVQGMIPYKHGYHYLHTFTTNNTFYRNSNDFYSLRRSVRTRAFKYNLFNLIIKVNPDYLPVTKSKVDFSRVNYAFEKQIIDKEYQFKKEVLSNGNLKISWKAKSASNIRLPIVMYKQSQLVLNKKLTIPKKYSLICAPTIKQKTGNNIAILNFKWPTRFKLLFGLTLISWLILIAYWIRELIFKVKSRRTL